MYVTYEVIMIREQNTNKDIDQILNRKREPIMLTKSQTKSKY